MKKKLQEPQQAITANGIVYYNRGVLSAHVQISMHEPIIFPILCLDK